MHDSSPIISSKTYTSSTFNGKHRIIELDYIRVLATFIVFLYHFDAVCSSKGWPSLFNVLNSSVNWGNSAVSIFFLLSGICLMAENANQSFSLSSYYRKRILRIYPMFYLVWAFCYVRTVLAKQSFVYLDNAPALILTIFGLDGYFYYKIPTYYFIGEWFLGALVILYIIFPILRLLISHKLPTFIFTIFVIVMVINAFTNPAFIILPNRNIATCLLSFWVGMILYKYLRTIKAACRFLSPFAIALTVMTIYFGKVIGMYASELEAFFLFIALFSTLTLVHRSQTLDKGVLLLSKYSYPVFLVHHITINEITSRYVTWATPDISFDIEFLILIVVVFYTLLFSLGLKGITLGFHNFMLQVSSRRKKFIK